MADDVKVIKLAKKALGPGNHPQWKRDQAESLARELLRKSSSVLLLIACAAGIVACETTTLTAETPCGTFYYTSGKEQVAPFAKCITADGAEVQIGSESATSAQARAVERMAGLVGALVAP